MTCTAFQHSVLGAVASALAGVSLLAGTACGGDDESLRDEPGATGATTDGGAPTEGATTEAETSATTTAPAETGTGGELPTGWTSCTNTRHGYSIGYPEDWFTTALDSATECSWFDRDEFELEEGTEGPLTDLFVRAATGSFEQAVRHLMEPYGERTLDRAALEVAGRQAVRFEKEQTEDLLYPEGTRTYGYVLDHDGNAFWVETRDVPGRDAPYAENKEVVDEAVRTVEFAEGD